ncbi:MAG: hypothetical protein AUG51_18605 [Acidobacteria bacterium 13_1_20CM_3_53_8]|nr:MAG: hypothetical protein AUG51_18605 [Acidobacteria bacterium 13_1_20CM_3_53_8]
MNKLYHKVRFAATVEALLRTDLGVVHIIKPVKMTSEMLSPALDAEGTESRRKGPSNKKKKNK